MNSKRFYDTLESMNDKDIMNCISACIEYLINARECDFKKILKHLKKTHNFIERVRGEE